MKLRVPVTPIRLGITFAFVLAAPLLAQDRGGTPPGDGQMLIGGVFSKADASGSLEYWWDLQFQKVLSGFSQTQEDIAQRGLGGGVVAGNVFRRPQNEGEPRR